MLPGRFCFPIEQTVLFGFSQGCLMMWEAGVRYPYRFAGCIDVSGFMREAALSLSIQHLLQLEVAEELSTTYQKALAANAFLARDQNDAFGRELANQIKESIVADGLGAIHWPGLLGVEWVILGGKTA